MEHPFWADLPVEAQIVLASGYIAYSLGYFGTKRDHKASDVVLRTLAFSLVATSGMYIVQLCFPQSPIGIRGTAAVVVSVAVGCLWRGWGSMGVFWFMRTFDISWSGDDGSALATVTKDSKHRVSQIAVELHDGSWLRCDDTSVFSSAPFGPCIIGEDGSVALYLTHTVDPSGVVKDMNTTIDDDFGHRLTYVPSSRVSMLNVRHG